MMLQTWSSSEKLELYRYQIKWDLISNCKIIQQSELIFFERKLISTAMRFFLREKEIFSIANVVRENLISIAKQCRCTNRTWEKNSMKPGLISHHMRPLLEEATWQHRSQSIFVPFLTPPAFGSDLIDVARSAGGRPVTAVSFAVLLAS